MKCNLQKLLKDPKFQAEVAEIKTRLNNYIKTPTAGLKAAIDAPWHHLITVGKIDVQYKPGKLEFTCGLAIDADGSPHAYNPSNTGLDDNQNAKDEDGDWVGIATRNGVPYIQDQNEPAPGYYVSTTAYQLKQFHVSSPDRYLDSEKIPYFVLPPQIILAVPEIVLGSKFWATNLENEKFTDGIIGDVGPNSKLGEGSMFLADPKLGINNDPKNGGETNKIIKVTVMLGSQWDKNYPLQHYT